MVIFHTYVSLPEGILTYVHALIEWKKNRSSGKSSSLSTRVVHVSSASNLRGEGDNNWESIHPDSIVIYSSCFLGLTFLSVPFAPVNFKEHRSMDHGWSLKKAGWLHLTTVTTLPGAMGWPGHAWVPRRPRGFAGKWTKRKYMPNAMGKLRITGYQWLSMCVWKWDSTIFIARRSLFAINMWFLAGMTRFQTLPYCHLGRMANNIGKRQFSYQ